MRAIFERRPKSDLITTRSWNNEFISGFQALLGSEFNRDSGREYFSNGFFRDARSISRDFETIGFDMTVVMPKINSRIEKERKRQLELELDDKPLS